MWHIYTTECYADVKRNENCRQVGAARGSHLGWGATEVKWCILRVFTCMCLLASALDTCVPKKKKNHRG